MDVEKISCPNTTQVSAEPEERTSAPWVTKSNFRLETLCATNCPSRPGLRHYLENNVRELKNQI